MTKSRAMMRCIAGGCTEILAGRLRTWVLACGGASACPLHACVRFIDEAAGEAGSDAGVTAAAGTAIAKHIITPSARYSGHVRSTARAALARRFTYEPPEGVKWSA